MFDVGILLFVLSNIVYVERVYYADYYYNLIWFETCFYVFIVYVSSSKFNVWFWHSGCTDYRVETQTESED